MTEEKQPPPIKKVSPWKIVHGFIDDSTGLAVDISQTSDVRPRFSIKVGKRSKEGHMLPFIPMYSEGVAVKSIVTTIESLVLKAELWINEKLLEARVEFDLFQASRGKPVTRHTGKTQKNRDKHKGE